jgi:hypothetical protein
MLALVLTGILVVRLAPPRQTAEPESANPPAADADWTPSQRPRGETFSLTVDFGNGAEMRFAALRWRERMTVLDAMQAAADFRPGITFTHQGSDATAFLTTIDGLKNAGAGGGNWLYEVNGEKASVGIGVRTLAPRDALLWRYTSPE